MSQLMLIAGFKHGTDVSNLKGYIRATFPEHKICHIWMDPFMEPRAVVLFDRELELKDIHNKSSGETSSELSRYVDVAKPTESVFVKTYKSLNFGTKDKLKYLFSSQRNGGSKVLKVEQLKTADKDCYEIYFLNWDAVLMACKHTWKVESQTLTVIPYFESFKEPVNQQLQRLIELNNTTKQVVTANKGSTLSSPSAMWELNKACLKPLPPQPFYTAQTDIKTTRYAIESLIKTESKNQEHVSSLPSEPAVSDLTSDHQEKKIITTVKQSKPPSENKADLKHAKPLLEHPYILMLLHLLNFEKAVQNRFSTAMVTIHESTWEVEITGHFASVKKIQKMLTEEDELDHSTLFGNFLLIEAVQQDLKTFIDSGGFFVDIVDANGKPHLQVKNGEGKQESLQDFISSLVIAKECHSLPTERFQEHTVWRDFMQSFKSTYSHQQIFVHEKSVILVSLTYKAQDFEVILNIINNTIVQLEANDSSGLKSGSCAETVAHPDEISQENLTSNDSSQSSADTSSVQTKTGSKSKKIIICLQNSFFLWILNALNMKEAVKQRTSSFVIDIDEEEEEIIISGTKELVQDLKSVLMAENKKLPFTDHEQEFLSDASIQQHLKSYLTESGCHIVLEDNLDISVASNDGKKVQLRPFLASFIQFTECSHLPEKYQTTEDWMAFFDYFKNNCPHQYILTADGKVHLLSIAPDERSYSINSAVEMINAAISGVMSAEPSEKMDWVCSSETLTDQKSSPDHKFEGKAKTESPQMSGTDRSSRQKEIMICCHHSTLPWILNILHLSEAVKKIGVHVTFNSADEIILRGPIDIVEDLKTVLLKEDNEMPFESLEEEFLADAQVQQDLRSCLKDLEAHVVLAENLELFVVTKNEEQESLMTFLTSIIQVRICLRMPEKFHITKEWKTLVDQFNQQHHQHNILVAEEEVYLLTIGLGDASHDADTIVENIRSMLHGSELNDDYEQHDILLSCHKMKIKYFTKFLQNELFQIQARYQETYRAVISISEEGLKIYSISQVMNSKMQADLEQALSQIVNIEHLFHYPGLIAYLKSMETSLIVSLQDKYKCLIEIPDIESSHFQSMSMNEEQSLKNLTTLEYTVALLGTANCNGFRIHLVQGDIQDLNLEMKVDIQPSTTVELCEVRGKRSSQNLILQLPCWSAPSEAVCHTHFENLKSSFEKTVCLVLDQTEHIKVTSIAFSTTQLDAVEKPFPAGVIAKVLVEKLYERFGTGSASQRENGSLDIYICDTRNEAISKAFTFFLKLRGAYIGPPNQDSWDKVCFQESYKCPDYNSLLKPKGTVVEVVTHTPFWMENKMCIFYPIHPTLEIDTCPAVKESKSAHFKVKSSLSDLQQQNPDGLLACEIFPVQGFHDSRKAFVYCSPDWGMDSKKAIEVIMEECITKSTAYEEVYIVPPGMQLLSKYPVAYLAQTLFRKLDSLIQNQPLSGITKKIALITQDAVYKKAFDKELQKRYPRRQETSYYQKFKDVLWNSFFSPKEKENMHQEEVRQSVIRESIVPSTKIRFWGRKEFDFQNAVMDLEKHLKGMMTENRTTVKLDKETTQKLQPLLKDIQDLPVQIKYQENYETKKQKKNKSKHKKKGKKDKQEHSKPAKVLSSCDLTLQGLSKQYVDEFLNLLGVGRDMEVVERQVKKEEAHAESNISLNVTGEPHENYSQQKGGTLDNNEDASGEVPLDAPVQVAHYKWMFETKPCVSFADIGDIGNLIEAAYSEEVVDSKNLGGKFKCVDFTTMTVEEATLKGIIRTEVFESAAHEIRFPMEWTLMPKREIKFKLELLEENSEEFKLICSELQSHLKQHSLSQVKISRVQNKNLYTRFVQKSSQMQILDTTTIMWHRVLSNYRTLVCKYGFHPRFSGMPAAKHLGDGVLFCKDPNKCLDPTVHTEEEICLIYSSVLVGKSGPGKPRLRCPPFDMNTREPYDSVCENGACMIFSDAQAYPVKLVVLQIKS